MDPLGLLRGELKGHVPPTPPFMSMVHVLCPISHA